MISINTSVKKNKVVDDDRVDYSNLSIDEKKYLDTKVYVVEGNIIAIESMDNRSYEQMQYIMDRLDNLTENFESFYLMADMSNTKDRGDPAYRAWTRKQVLMREKMKFITYVVERNILMRTFLGFITKRILPKENAICRTREEAIEKINNYKKSNKLII